MATGRTPDSSHGGGPPPYKKTEEHRSRVTVHCGNSRRGIVADITDFEALRNTIANRFNLQGNFLLQIEDPDGERIDLYCDDDLEDNSEFVHTIWVVDRPPPQAMSAETTHALTSVTQHGVTYSLIEPLDPDCQLVVGKTAEMQEQVGIPLLSSRLEDVADCLQLAYYASAEDHNLQMQVQEMQFAVENLCRECTTTMVRMHCKAGDALDEMQSGIGYMLEGFENFGLARLKAVGECAGEILKATKSLTKLLESINKTVQTKGVDKACYLLDDKEKAAEKATEAVSKKPENIHLFRFKKMITLGFYKGSKQICEQQQRLDLEVKKIEEKERDRLEELKKAEKEADSALAEAAERLVSLKEDPHQMAIIALSAAKAAMKTLVSILLTISFFWSLCEIEFESIGQLCSIKHLQTLSNSEERRIFWQGKAFKNAAFKSVVRFSVVQKMCKDFQRTLTPVMEDIHLCIRDNPTRKMAQRKLLPLVEEFQRKTKKKRAALEQMKSSRDHGDALSVSN